ncbi:MAG: flagellar basal-body rod protein FlgF [Selenomonadaceae bacterium]|nr:flagellar basal-body rod protein FlgF [Selenomonadaceae bacterium]
MWRGLYTAASGMITETKRTDTIANNLANADTSGYKRDLAISGEFEKMLIKRINDYDERYDITAFKGFHVGDSRPRVGDLGMGSYIDEIATDLGQGAMETTGNQLDVAISGNGYFAVQTPEGVRYTRDGAFFRSAANGQLQTTLGQPVLNRQGRPINIPQNATSISFGPKGEVFVHQAGGDPPPLALIGQLQFVEFDDRRALLKQGNNLWRPQEGAQPRPATGTIEQGVLERSNANVVEEMVELVNNYRIYEAGSKAVVSQDALLDKAVNEVGRLS